MDQNKCADLPIEDRYTELMSGDKPVDTVSLLYNMQKRIQEDVYGYDFKDMQSVMGKMSDFFSWNYEAIHDELREFREAMGGMDSYKSSLWKPWKKDYLFANGRSYDDLTDSEKLELKYEWIDLLHFMFNLAIMIDLNPKEIFNLYIAKNKENINRQQRGY